MNVKNKLNLLSGTDAYEVLQAEEVMAEALEYIEELENLLDEQGGVINSQQKMLNEKTQIIDALKKENERLLEDAKRYRIELTALRSRGYQEDRVKVDKVISYPPVQLPPGWGEVLPKGWNDYKC